MHSQQFGDLPQIYGIDEAARFSGWQSNCYTYSYVDKQQTPGFSIEDESIYVDGLNESMMSMQPMQRFMFDPSPQSLGLLHANIPLQTQQQQQYDSSWHPSELYRNSSPDRTSVSATSSFASQNDVASPQGYNIVSYDNSAVTCQLLPPYHSVGQFSDVSYTSSSSGASISLKEIEYAHQEPEPTIEDAETIDAKQEPTVNSEQVDIKIETDPSMCREYTDSGIGNSVRDAESVQPVDFKDETDADSDYSPTSRSSGKRRRSAPHTRTSRRRSSARKDSVVSTSSRKKPGRRPRGATKSSGESQSQDDRRSFPCPLAAYNCTATFASKNEWKRHVSTQHIKLGYWRCDLCTPTIDPSDPTVFYYNDFNRKDLFTQHLRRMHAVHGSGARHLKVHPVNEENIGEHQTRCYMQLRGSPQQSICPVNGCDRDFIGNTSWDERMEHVGRHLEKDRKNSIDVLDVTSWKLDTALEKYLVDEDLITWDHGGWRISDGKARRVNSGFSDEDI